MIRLFIILSLLASSYQAQAISWKGFEEFKTDVVLNPKRAAGHAREFMDALKKEGTPLVEGNRVTFIYENTDPRDTRPVMLVGDFNYWRKSDQWYDGMLKLPGTNIYYQSFEFPPDARLDYQFVIGDSWILDPYNPDTLMSGYGAKSELNMPSYHEAMEIARNPDISHGELREAALFSRILGETRAFQIYTPANFDPKQNHPAIYVHDGYDFLSFAQLPNVLDNLIHQIRIPPVIAIFIPPVHRGEEYIKENKYGHFIVKELVPYIDRHYPTRRDPRFRATAGISAGGAISLNLGWTHPEVFGCVISQSGVANIADGRNEYVTYFAAQPRKNLKLYIDVGTFEWPGLLESNRLLKRVLAEKHYSHLYKEFHEGHSWGSWRSHIKYGLEFLWGREEEDEDED